MDIQAQPASVADSSGALTHVTCQQHRLHLCEREDGERAELERFVHDAFATKHAAHVHTFMPTLLAMRGDAGRLCGVAGFRCAAHEPLFLERYLDEPIEAAVQRATHCAVERSQIVEVGNLASVSCRAAMRLALELPRLLLARGQRWIVFTATSTVRQLLAAYDAPLVELACARSTRVTGMGDDWGRYYETDPRVMVGYLPDGASMRRRRR